MAESKQDLMHSPEYYIIKMAEGTMPKNFRVWDFLHERWFQGDPSEKSRQLQTDCVHYFGEIMVMEGTLCDQNEDDAWKKSAEAGDIRGSLDKMNYLCVVQDTGIKDRTGKHIFEGDILEMGETRGYVMYDKTHGNYYLAGDLVKIYCDLQDCKIIGSVFENYQLLNERDENG